MTLLIFPETSFFSHCCEHFIRTEHANQINVACVWLVVTAPRWEHVVGIKCQVLRECGVLRILGDCKNFGCRLVKLNIDSNGQWEQ